MFQVNPGLGFTFSGSENLEASFLVKTVDLPKYSFEVVEHNQYNRKRYHHNKINYSPVNITFHDDNSDVIRNMWYAYYAYYNNDPQYQQSGTYGYKDTYKPMMDNARQWGLDRNTQPFFTGIKIYSLYQLQRALVSPVTLLVIIYLNIQDGRYESRRFKSRSAHSLRNESNRTSLD